MTVVSVWASVGLLALGLCLSAVVGSVAVAGREPVEEDVFSAGSADEEGHPDVRQLAVNQASGDGGTVEIRIKAGGIGGYVDNVSDLMGPNGLHLFVVAEEGGANRGFYYWNLSEASLEADRGNDVYRVVVERDDVEGLGAHSGASPPDGSHRVVFGIFGGPYSDFWEEGTYPDDPAFNETWRMATAGEFDTRWNPYLGQSEQQIQTVTFHTGASNPAPTSEPPTTTTARPTTSNPATSPTATTGAETPTDRLTPIPTPSTTSVTASGGGQTTAPPTGGQAPDGDNGGNGDVLLGGLSLVAAILLIGWVLIWRGP